MAAVRDSVSRTLDSRPRARKLVLYSAASIVGVVASQIALIACLTVFDMKAVPANLVAVVVGGIPNYLINRAWTFNKRGPHSLTREVIPYWTLAFLGLLLSTIAVAWADRRFDGSVVAVSAANIGAFGLLWLGKFFIFEKYLFAPLARTLEGAGSEDPA